MIYREGELKYSFYIFEIVIWLVIVFLFKLIKMVLKDLNFLKVLII